MWGRDLFGAGGPLCIQWHSDIAGLSLECWGKEVLSIILPVGIVFTSIPKVITFLSLKWSEDVRATDSPYSNLPLCTREVEAQRRECLDEGHPAVKAGGVPAPRLPPHPGTSTLGAGRVPLPAHGPKFGFPSRSPRMTWGFSAAKSKLPLVFLNRWRLESWALTFPEGHKTLLSRCPLLFIAKSMKADTPLLGAMGKAPFPDAVTPDISGPAEATRMGSVVLGISGQGQAGCPPGGHCGH